MRRWIDTVSETVFHPDMRLCSQHACAIGVCALLSLSSAAWAGPGDGIMIASWVFSPYVDFSFTDDSNVYKDGTNKIHDAYYEPELGLRFSTSMDTNMFFAKGNVYYSVRNYDSETNRDFSAYGDHITLQIGNGRKSRLELVQSYRNLDDNDRHASDIESSQLSGEMVEDSNALDLERELNQLGASLSRRMSDKLDLALSYRYSGVHYPNETHERLARKQEEYVPEGLDLDGHIWQLQGALGVTDKTDLLLTLRQGLQYQEKTDGAAELTTARLGLQMQGAEKLVYNAGAGLEYYARPNQTQFADADVDAGDVQVTEEGVQSDNDQISFNFNASADWYMTEKLTFRCGGYNGTEFSSFYQDNGMEYLSAWTGLGYRWKPSTTISVRGLYRHDDYLDPVTHEGVTKDRKDDRLEGHARIDYLAPGEFLRLYLEAIYDEVDSNFDFVDYDEQRIIVGATLRY